VEWRRMEK